MNIEEFYGCIRHKNDPAKYEEIVAQLDDETYALSKNRTLTADTRFYLKQFLEHQPHKWFISRNIAASIYGPVWFAYRRMYLIAIIVVLIHIGLFLTLYEYVIGDYVSFIANFIIGFLGNAFYFFNTKRRLSLGYRSEASVKISLVFWGIIALINFILGLTLGFFGYFH
jgi:hypothetical protein